MSRIRRVIETLSDIGGYFSGLAVLLMMSFVMYEVFMRYVLNRAPRFADEISAYMLVALAFIGLAYTWKEKGHVRVEALVSRLPTRVSRWLRLGGLILALAFILLVSKVSFDFVVDTYTRGMISTTWLRVPIYLPGIALAIGFSLLSLQLIVEVAKAIMDIRSAIGEEAV